MLQFTCKFYLFIAVMLVVSTGIEVSGRAPQKIKGGTDANIEDYPFMVAIKDQIGLCGGTLISQKQVLTAAHCVTSYQPNRYILPLTSLQVILGHSDMMNSDELKVYAVDDIDVHETWMYQNIVDCFEADIAIVTLNETVLSLENHKIPRLPSVPAVKTTRGIMLGWGAKGAYGWASPRLQKATTVIVDYDYCKQYHDNLLADNTFCTMGERNDVSFCDGDSGGPFINDKGEIAGIISYTWDCSGRRANMFTDVYSYKAWILEILENAKAAATTTEIVQEHSTGGSPIMK